MEIVKTIFTEWNTDKYENFEKLAKKLRAEGIKRGNNDWTRNNISDVLTNPIYMGVRIATFDNREVTRSVEDLAVIVPEDFELAQKLIENRKKPKKEKQKFHYLLEDLLLCELCKKKPLIKSERMKKGRIYATYECKEHGITLEQQEIEKLVYFETKKFFSELLNTHFDKLYSNQLKQNLADIRKLMRNLEKELQLAEEKLVQATSKWINKETVANGEKILECYKDVQTIKQKIFDLDVIRQKYVEVPHFVKEIQGELMKEETWELLAFERKKLLMNDLIQFIVVDSYTTKIVFKHPYLESNGVKI